MERDTARALLLRPPPCHHRTGAASPPDTVRSQASLPPLAVCLDDWAPHPARAGRASTGRMGIPEGSPPHFPLGLPPRPCFSLRVIFSLEKMVILSSLFVCVRRASAPSLAAGPVSGEPPVADSWRLMRASLGAGIALVAWLGTPRLARGHFCVTH